jgi:hypothetical protein
MCNWMLDPEGHEISRLDQKDRHKDQLDVESKSVQLHRQSHFDGDTRMTRMISSWIHCNRSLTYCASWKVVEPLSVVVTMAVAVAIAIAIVVRHCSNHRPGSTMKSAVSPTVAVLGWMVLLRLNADGGG